MLTDYAARLTATMPDPLEVLFVVNSGSEANDLALRMFVHKYLYLLCGATSFTWLLGSAEGFLTFYFRCFRIL